MFATRRAAANIRSRTRPVVRPRNCPPSSLTVPDTSDGPEGWTVCVTVTVGAGDGDAVAVVVGVGVGVGSTVGTSQGPSEVGPYFAAETPLTLNISDDVADESAEDGEETKLIHYRPQLRTRAVTRTESSGSPTANTETANAGAGADTGNSEREDIRSQKPCH
jgi:hypothetical protein